MSTKPCICHSFEVKRPIILQAVGTVKAVGHTAGFRELRYEI